MAATDLDAAVKKMARDHPTVRRLMTNPGVGPVVSLNFIALVDEPAQFSKTLDVGASLGLTPKRHQSGAVNWSGRVSKCDDGVMRSLLFEAATSRYAVVIWNEGRQLKPIMKPLINGLPPARSRQ